MKKVLCILAAALTLTVTCSAAYSPYYTYNYNSDLEAVSSAASYLPSYSIGSGENTHISLKTPSDLEIEGDLCYVADTGNNRIVILDVSQRRPEMVRQISTFTSEQGEDALKQPSGVCVIGNELYVADTENHRLVVFDTEGNFLRIIAQPQIDTWAVDVEYKPSKVGVDGNGRIYVVGLSVTEGIIQLEPDGTFVRFFGSNRVVVDFYELALRFFLSKEAQKMRISFIPVEYSNITVDKDNFVYATCKADTNQVKKLNTSGNNILRTDARTKNVYGDIHYQSANIVDVTVDQSGNLFVLDSRRGKIFQYNELGDLLAIFGGNGTAVGTFTTPTAIDCTEDGRVFVSDSAKNTIAVFEATDFGTLVNEANAKFIKGDYQESMETWKQVLKRNANFDLAYIGMGHAYLQTGDYEQALECYEMGKYKKGYSDAYAEHRTKLLGDAFPWIMTVLLIVVILWFIFRKQIAKIPAKIKAFVDP
ncbi:MAG: tetratricopeptide repeat protein [Oscillospiraceae bacterium]|nr:tetratricopeptide repeat protein [Oscillospiraceae bacterium]